MKSTLDLRKIARSQGGSARAKTILSEREVAIATSTCPSCRKDRRGEEKKVTAEIIRSGDEGASRKSSIGIVGGGQLGRMLTEAAQSLGFKVVVINPTPGSPAGQVGAEEIIADLYNEDALRELASKSDIMTIEIEHLDADALEKIATTRKPIHPSPSTIRLIQDKYTQKAFLRAASIPVADFIELKSLEQAQKALRDFGGKMLLKARHGAYDGRGNALVKSTDELAVAWQRFKNKALYAEAYVPFVKELAVMVARSTNGEIKAYPVVETFHERNICIEVHAPAQVDQTIADTAQNLAISVAKHLSGAGVFGIEMFLTKEGDVMINEIAPRVHNSGHHTIEANSTSQFEQHIRAITGMPLGATNLKVPAAVMINILGDHDGEPNITGLKTATTIPNTYVHLYGKSPVAIDRKMGHITATGKNIQEAQKRAHKARKAITI